MAQLAIFYNQHSWMGKLTKIFTGSYAYHAGWICEAEDKFYDMHLIRRRRIWSKERIDREYRLYDFPFVTYNYLEMMNDIDINTYGFIDYILFAVRPVYHLFGKSTRNMHGVICSEMCNWDLIRCGYTTPFSATTEPPSPADLEKWINILKSIKGKQ